MVGVSIPRIVERIGYALLYGLWASVAILFVTVSLYMVADRLVMGNDDVRTADTVLFFFLGLFIAVLWFISLRKLLRRHADHDDEPSIPMRVAQVALYALWLLVALGIFLEGMFEFRTFDKTDAAIPLWTCAAAVMALTWLAALKWFSFRTADRWDHPSNPRPDMLPSDTPYIMPFAHLYLLITVPAVAGIVVYVFGLILWLG